jgi:hypothetical protein
LTAAAARFTAATRSPDAGADLVLTAAQVEWALRGATSQPELAYLLSKYYAHSAAQSSRDKDAVLSDMLDSLEASSTSGELAQVAAWCSNSINLLEEDTSERALGASTEQFVPGRVADAANAAAQSSSGTGEAAGSQVLPQCRLSGDALSALSALLLSSTVV